MARQTRRRRQCRGIHAIQHLTPPKPIPISDQQIIDRPSFECCLIS